MLDTQTKYGNAIGQTPIFCPVCWDLREACVDEVTRIRHLLVPVVWARLSIGRRRAFECVCAECGVRLEEDVRPPLLEGEAGDIVEAAARLRPELVERFAERSEREAAVLEGSADSDLRLRVLVDRMVEIDPVAQWYAHGAVKAVRMSVWTIVGVLVIGFGIAVGVLFNSSLVAGMVLIPLVPLVLLAMAEHAKAGYGRFDPNMLAARSLAPFSPDRKEIVGAVRGARKRGATLSEVRADYVEHNIKALHFAESRRAEVAGA